MVSKIKTIYNEGLDDLTSVSATKVTIFGETDVERVL